MARISVCVLDGPFKGEVFALDRQDGGELSLRTADGQVAIYRMTADTEWRYDRAGERVRYYQNHDGYYPYDGLLTFVGWDPFG